MVRRVCKRVSYRESDFYWFCQVFFFLKILNFILFVKPVFQFLWQFVPHENFLLDSFLDSKSFIPSFKLAWLQKTLFPKRICCQRKQILPITGLWLRTVLNFCVLMLPFKGTHLYCTFEKKSVQYKRRVFLKGLLIKICLQWKMLVEVWGINSLCCWKTYISSFVSIGKVKHFLFRKNKVNCRVIFLDHIFQLQQNFAWDDDKGISFFLYVKIGI